jgi:hypothetical protein
MAHALPLKHGVVDVRIADLLVASPDESPSRASRREPIDGEDGDEKGKKTGKNHNPIRHDGLTFESTPSVASLSA